MNESKGHDHIRQKKEVNLLSLFRIFFSQIAILINLLYCHPSDNYLHAVLKKLKHEKYLFNIQNNHFNVDKEFMLFLL